jgi:hypothetical protein
MSFDPFGDGLYIITGGYVTNEDDVGGNLVMSQAGSGKIILTIGTVPVLLLALSRGENIPLVLENNINSEFFYFRSQLLGYVRKTLI